ncbi:MAG: dockerin type I domain-containing protein [Planctomycetota bacterium]|nr:dockerin type I domain-containing protein [Planctomycetota bacterium]
MSRKKRGRGSRSAVWGLSGRRSRRPLYERLEERVMLSGSSESQEFVYLLNLARHDPAKFARDFGLSADLSQVAARPPLALNDLLSTAATARADELAQYNYFQHQSTVTGKWPNQLVREAGYMLPADWPNAANFIESLAAGTNYTTADVPLKTLLTDADESSLIHRRQLLGIDEAFAANREIGVGLAFSTTATFGNYWAVETARREPAAPFLTGVVFNDANQNGQYDLGEGLAGVTITAGGLTTTTNAAGGWSLPVTPGTHHVTATGSGLPAAAANVRVGQDNVELDFVAGRPRGLVNFAGWQNSLEPSDVNGDGRLTPLDALLLINEVNRLGPRALSGLWTGSTTTEYFWDVSGDDQVSALDVLQVIDALSAPR